jgi:triosephosphate isomerase
MRLVVANWKMNKTESEVRQFVEDLGRESFSFGNSEVSLAPAYPFLALAADPARRWSICAQDCSAERAGAFTGEVSAEMLASLECRYVLVGHSERRKYFHESEVILGFKLERARESGLIPIFCVGETLQEHEEKKTESVLVRQLESLENDSPGSPLVVAYEPVWAIGTGRHATPRQAARAAAFLTERLSAYRDLRILYGGSVTPNNAASLVAEGGIDGFLVGGASLDPPSFASICRAAA